MTDDLLDAFPDALSEPLPGHIVLQWIQCGKPGCRCQSGQRHGPYHYRIWREGQKVCKEYVKVTDLEAVQKRICLFEQMAQKLKRLTQQRQALSTSLARRRVIHKKLTRQLDAWEAAAR